MNAVTLGQWDILGRLGRAVIGSTTDYFTRAESGRQQERMLKALPVIPPPPPLGPPALFPEIPFRFEEPVPTRPIRDQRPWYADPLTVGGIAAAGLAAYLLLRRK